MGPVVGRGVPGEEEIHRSNKDGNSARQEGGGEDVEKWGIR
jgi:hypothetical protein